MTFYIALFSSGALTAASTAVVVSARPSAAFWSTSQVFELASEAGYRSARVLRRLVIPGAVAQLVFDPIFSGLVIPGGIIRLAVAPVDIGQRFSGNPVELSFTPAVVKTDPAEKVKSGYGSCLLVGADCS